MEVESLKNLILEVLDEKGAGEVQIFNISQKSSIADYFIIATGKNQAHVRSLAEFLEQKVEERNITVTRKEGHIEARWIVLDYVDIIVHIFNKDTREFFCLEQLWS